VVTGESWQIYSHKGGQKGRQTQGGSVTDKLRSCFETL